MNDTPPPVDHDAIDALLSNNHSPWGKLEAVKAARQAERDAADIRLLTLADLEQLRPPTWRIDNVLPDASFATIFGVQSTYKSFIALDWSLSIAAGVAWLDHPTTAGTAVYIAAEGGPGLLKRIRAWQATHDHEAAALDARFRVIPHAVDLMDPLTVDALRRALDEQLDVAPDLLVVDTWSRSIPGGNENAAEVVSAAIGYLDRIRGDLDCGIAIVHHAGIETGRERGSSSLPYAMDCRWETDGKPNQSTITLRNHKQKDWETTAPILLQRHVVGDGDSASLIMRRAGDPCARHHQVVAALDDAGPLTQNKLVQLLTGSKATCIRDAQDAAACDRCPVQSWQDGRSMLYGRTDQFAVAL